MLIFSILFFVDISAVKCVFIIMFIHCIFSFRYGVEALFRFYMYGLEKKFRPEIYLAFQKDTMADMKSGQLYGVEKFWMFTKKYVLYLLIFVIPI